MQGIILGGKANTVCRFIMTTNTSHQKGDTKANNILPGIPRKCSYIFNGKISMALLYSSMNVFFRFDIKKNTASICVRYFEKVNCHKRVQHTFYKFECSVHALNSLYCFIHRRNISVSVPKKNLFQKYLSNVKNRTNCVIVFSLVKPFIRH